MEETKVIRDLVFVAAPQVTSLAESESFVIGETCYTVEPDVTGKVAGGKDGRFYFNQSKGFAGREFAIDTFDGRRIVTHNLWEGEQVEEPDTAEFVGPAAKPVRLVSHNWDRR